MAKGSKKRRIDQKTGFDKLVWIIVGVVILGSIFGFLVLFSLTLLTMESSDRVAVVQIRGTIGIDADQDSIIYLLDEAEEDPSVASVLLDISSGGGTPVATRGIGERIKELRNKKPVVAWIGESGTSGAYWIATCANVTMADPLSQVGSIGVILQLPELTGLMDNLGIKMNVIKGGEYKDIGNPFKNMTDSERKILEDIASEMHEIFIYEISQNRNMNYSYVEGLSDGSIFLGKTALELGLIDSVGTKKDAIKLAASLGDIEPEWFYLRDERFSTLLGDLASPPGSIFPI